MKFLVIEESAKIESSCDRAYSIIADYHKGHPSILPKEFHSLEVEKGGTGAGTVIRFQARVFGRNQTMRAEITEPEPGRILLETYPDTGTETSFIVEPDGADSKVTISTKLPLRPGALGKFEGWFLKRFLRPVFKKELENLNRVARE
jgi:polyketide cyclase/dehydrase/lipid transport protein